MGKALQTPEIKLGIEHPLDGLDHLQILVGDEGVGVALARLLGCRVLVETFV